MNEDFIIIRAKKTYRNGAHIKYLLIERVEDCNIDDQINEALRYFGEHSDGGQSEGYNVSCLEIIKRPSDILLKHLLKRTRREEADIRARMENALAKNRKAETFLENIHSRKLSNKYRDVYDRIAAGESFYKLGEFGYSITYYAFVKQLKEEKIDKNIIEWLLERNYLTQGRIDIESDKTKYKFKIIATYP